VEPGEVKDVIQIKKVAKRCRSWFRKKS